MRCAHAHSYNRYCAHGLLKGSCLKKKSVSGGSFIRGMSIKEELNTSDLNEVCLFLNSIRFYPVVTYGIDANLQQNEKIHCTNIYRRLTTDERD